MQTLDEMTLKKRRDLLLTSQKVPMTYLEDAMFVYHGPFTFQKAPIFVDPMFAAKPDGPMPDGQMPDIEMGEEQGRGQKRRDPPEVRAGDEEDFNRYYGDADYNRRRYNPVQGEKRKERPEFRAGDEIGYDRFYGEADYNRRRYEGTNRAKSSQHPGQGHHYNFD